MQTDPEMTLKVTMPIVLEGVNCGPLSMFGYGSGNDKWHEELHDIGAQITEFAVVRGDELNIPFLKVIKKTATKTKVLLKMQWKEKVEEQSKDPGDDTLKTWIDQWNVSVGRSLYAVQWENEIWLKKDYPANLRPTYKSRYTTFATYWRSLRPTIKVLPAAYLWMSYRSTRLWNSSDAAVHVEAIQELINNGVPVDGFDIHYYGNLSNLDKRIDVTIKNLPTKDGTPIPLWITEDGGPDRRKALTRYDSLYGVNMPFSDWFDTLLKQEVSARLATVRSKSPSGEIHVYMWFKLNTLYPCAWGSPAPSFYGDNYFCPMDLEKSFTRRAHYCTMKEELGGPL